MNNEEKILALLEQQGALLEKVDGRLSKLEQGQVETNKRLDAIDERLDSIDYSLNQAWKDIGLVEGRVKQHEREFHSIGIK